MPLVDPMNTHSSQAQGDTEPVSTAKPTLIYFSTEPTKEEWNQIFSIAKDGVALTGSAAAGSIMAVLVKRDIAEIDDSYFFRVALPGVTREGFNCTVDPDGRVTIKGVTTTEEKTVYRHFLKSETLTQNMCPPGDFSISFNLPGPVKPQDMTSHLGNNGIYEATVKKA